MIAAGSVLGCGFLLGTSDDDAIEPGPVSDAAPFEDAPSEDAPILPLDSSALDVALDVAQDADAADVPLRMFVTSGTFTGNGLNGREGGDARCAAAAAAAGLGGTFLAYLELQEHPAGSRFPDSGTWVRIDGQTAFTSGLTTPQVPLNVTENGFTLVDGLGERVWTGVPTFMGAPVANCGDWQVFSNGDRGNPFTTGIAWRAEGNSSCNAPYHLYCFEVR